MRYKAIVIGTSAGGIEALKIVLSKITATVILPIIIVQHLSPKYESYLSELIEDFTGITTKEIADKESVLKNTIYVAPPNYHILIEKDFTISLTTGRRVSYARPSIDVLFETAADAYREELIGILLTGANRDGANGLKAIHDAGGYTMVQTPSSAYASEMPESALELIQPDQLLDLEEIGEKLNYMMNVN